MIRLVGLDKGFPQTVSIIVENLWVKGKENILKLFSKQKMQQRAKKA